MRKVLGAEAEVDPEAPLMAAGLDSLAAVELTALLSQQVPPAKPACVVHDIIAFVVASCTVYYAIMLVFV